MSYTPTTYVEGVTKLGPTNMNHLETGVQAVGVVADAAVAKPIAPVTNAGLVWSGSAWVAALLVNGNIDPAANIAYSKLTLSGSIVNNDIASGAAVAYSKLSLTGGIVNTDISASAAIAASKIANVLKTTVGTLAAGPPGAPATNDIWIATDVDSNGTVWTFRYNSSEATYKWEFIGGAAMYSEVATLESTSSATYTALGTAGPSLALSRAGDYDVVIGALTSSATSAGQQPTMSYDIGGTGAVDADAVQGAAQSGGSLMRTRRKTAIAVSTTLTAKYKSVTANGTGYANRFIAVTPVRII